MGRRVSGFTLVELLVTLAVLAIVLAIAVPNMSGFIAKQRVSRLSDTLVSNLQFARLEAIKYNQKVCLAVNPDTSTYLKLTRKSIDCDCSTSTGTCAGQSSYELSKTEISPTTLSSFSTELNNAYIDPVRGIWTFSSNQFTDKSFDISNSDKQLRLKLRFNGQMQLCNPVSSKKVGGYPAC